ncbi:hypothetical protein Q3G72_019054 [Acer saccharum]|nr:hypothetical protein Q3G72_019054 [Acer saccharum]
MCVRKFKTQFCLPPPVFVNFIINLPSRSHLVFTIKRNRETQYKFSLQPSSSFFDTSCRSLSKARQYLQQ